MPLLLCVNYMEMQAIQVKFVKSEIHFLPMGLKVLILWETNTTNKGGTLTQTHTTPDGGITQTYHGEGIKIRTMAKTNPISNHNPTTIKDHLTNHKTNNLSHPFTTSPLTANTIPLAMKISKIWILSWKQCPNSRR